MSVLIIFIQKAIVQGICILYGALGEIMTEKTGNLNLGIPGIMYMGGISGLMGAFLYEKDNPDPNVFIGVLISFVCAFAFFPRNPMDVLQINLSNIINIAGRIKITATVLITAPRASKVQIALIISIFE